MVKTPPFHGGNTGSNPVGVIFFNKEHIILIWRRSQVVRHGTATPKVVGSNPAPATKKDFREYLRSFSFCKNLRYKKEIVHQISV